MVALIGAAGVIIAEYVTVTKVVEAKVSKVTKCVEEKTAATETRLNATVGALAANTPGSLEKGQKLCRVLQGKTWRDGLIVPQNWSISLCVDYMKKTGGNGYQLGCIYTDGTNLGKEDGSLPSPNCGWQ